MRHTYYVIFLVVFSIFFVGCGDTGAEGQDRSAALSVRLDYDDLRHIVAVYESPDTLSFNIHGNIYETSLFQSLSLEDQKTVRNVLEAEMEFDWVDTKSIRLTGSEYYIIQARIIKQGFGGSHFLLDMAPLRDFSDPIEMIKIFFIY